MNTRWSDALFSVSALALVGLMSSCTGTGGDEIWIHFGLNGDGDAGCTEVLAELDISASGAFPSRRDDGSFHCALSGDLERQGCKARFTEAEGLLLVEIHRCTVPAGANLFRCAFTDAVLSQVEGAVALTCDCDRPDCDPTPPVCLGQARASGAPGPCENCRNRKDDDGDLLTDCFDPGCDASRLCETPTTTTTSSTSTTLPVDSTTSTSSTSSTTTLVPPGSLFTVVFGMTNSVPVQSLTWTASYPGPVLRQRAVATNPQCRSLVDVTSDSFENDEDLREVLANQVLAEPMAGPVELAECTFEADEMPAVEDFSVEVLDARDADGEPIDLPTVSADEVRDESTTTTTTTMEPTTTTTTLPPATTPYEVWFQLDTASTSLGALQFSADYTDAPGGFDGVGGAVVCNGQIAGALFAPNNNVAARKLTLGLVSFATFAAPTDLAVCTFLAQAGEVPVPADFELTIEDITDGGGLPATATISVDVRVP